MTYYDGRGTKPLDTPNLKTPEECKNEGHMIPEIELTGHDGSPASDFYKKQQKEDIEYDIKTYGCDYYEKRQKQLDEENEKHRKEDEENAKRTKEATEKYGEDAAYWINKRAMPELPKYTVGTLVHTIDSAKNKDGTMVKDLKVKGCRPGPNGWNYELEDITDPNEFVPRYDEWKINWEPGEPKFPVNSEVKFISPLTSIHTWKVKEITLIGYEFVYTLIQKNIIPNVTTVTQKNMIRQSELKAVTQAGGRRRKTMKKSRKMRRKTNKKVRKMRRKSMKKSHKKK